MNAVYFNMFINSLVSVRRFYIMWEENANYMEYNSVKSWYLQFT